MNSKNFILSIFDYLETLPNDKPMLFIDGEFDSQQTNFEKKSNHLEIGVLADNKDVGYVLLFFLRAIFDNYKLKYIIDYIGDYIDLNSPMEKIIGEMKNFEREYAIIYKPNSKEIMGCLYDATEPDVIEIFITKKVSEIDCWDLKRIKTKITELN